MAYESYSCPLPSKHAPIVVMERKRGEEKTSEVRKSAAGMQWRKEQLAFGKHAL